MDRVVLPYYFISNADGCSSSDIITLYWKDMLIPDHYKHAKYHLEGIWKAAIYRIVNMNHHHFMSFID